MRIGFQLAHANTFKAALTGQADVPFYLAWLHGPTRSLPKIDRTALVQAAQAMDGLSIQGNGGRLVVVDGELGRVGSGRYDGVTLELWVDRPHAELVKAFEVLHAVAAELGRRLSLTVWSTVSELRADSRQSEGWTRSVAELNDLWVQADLDEIARAAAAPMVDPSQPAPTSRPAPASGGIPLPATSPVQLKSPGAFPWVLVEASRDGTTLLRTVVRVDHPAWFPLGPLGGRAVDVVMEAGGRLLVPRGVASDTDDNGVCRLSDKELLLTFASHADEPSFERLAPIDPPLPDAEPLGEAGDPNPFYRLHLEWEKKRQQAVEELEYDYDDTPPLFEPWDGSETLDAHDTEATATGGYCVVAGFGDSGPPIDIEANTYGGDEYQGIIGVPDPRGNDVIYHVYVDGDVEFTFEASSLRALCRAVVQAGVVSDFDEGDEWKSRDHAARRSAIVGPPCYFAGPADWAEQLDELPQDQRCADFRQATPGAWVDMLPYAFIGGWIALAE